MTRISRSGRAAIRAAAGMALFLCLTGLAAAQQGSDGCGGASSDPRVAGLVAKATNAMTLSLASKEAGDALREALALDPKNAVAYNRLYLHLSRGLKDPAAAAALLQRAAQALPDCGPVHFDLGNALSDARRHGEAAQAYRKAVALTPDPPAGMWFNLGNALFHSGDPRGAIDAYRAALERDPAHGKAKQNLTIAYIRVEDHESLQALYGKDARTLSRIGSAYLQRENYGAAARYYEQSLELVENEGARFNLAIALMRLDRKAEAKAQLVKLYGEHPRNPKIRGLMDELSK